MAEYRRGAHTVFEIHLHLVWITKYRRPALTGEIATRVRDLIRDICGQHEVSIMKGHVSKDHVHLLISLPPQVTISRLMQWLKGRTAHHPLAEFPHLKKQFWGRHLWARGYFCCKFRQRDRRRHCEVHRRAEHERGRRLQSRWLSPSAS
jgi:putative transposase